MLIILKTDDGIRSIYIWSDFFESKKKNLGADFEIQPLKVERKSKNSEKCSISRLWEPVTQKLLQDFFLKLSTIP